VPTVKPPSEPTIESMDGEFKTRRATMRGITYVLRELDATEYEKCLKAATTATEDGRSTIDNALMFKLMLDKSLIEPKLASGELWKKPYPVIRKLNDVIDELHYSPEESDEEKADDDAGEAKA